STYDHRTLKTRLPVRSALFKQRTGGLVVKSVTISESPLLYVFGLFLADVGPMRVEETTDTLRKSSVMMALKTAVTGVERQVLLEVQGSMKSTISTYEQRPAVFKTHMVFRLRSHHH
ncbi:hypothetical protein IQ06DRAFT_363822, partial [Phaeosphaeriaceae sp. SRC1lsM3a]